MELDSLQIGDEILGPIFYRFCYQLWLHQLCYQSDTAVALFMSRGGFRLRYYYNLFLAVNQLSPPCPQNDIYVSRMGVFKAGVVRNIGWMVDQLVAEYAWHDIPAAMGMLLPERVCQAWINSLSAEERAACAATRFTKEFLLDQFNVARRPNSILRNYFADQHEMLRRHLQQVSGQSEQLLLVDTGWSGSIVGALRDIYPEFNMTAHYFGRYNYGGQEKPWFPHVIGVEVEGHDFVVRKPITSIFLHRHLIEGICEVKWHSVEGYTHDAASKESVPDRGRMPEELRAPGEDNPLAMGIANYITRHRMKENPHLIQIRANNAACKLAKIICYPSPAIAEAATVKTRSADFGKDLDVPVLKRPLPLSQLQQKRVQIRESLWPQGQIALEFPHLHRIVQFAYLKLKRRK